MEGVRFLLVLGIVLTSVTAPAVRAEEIRRSPDQRRMRVGTAVADLRKEPAPAGPTLEHDPLQESQLLYGDPVRVLEVRGEWARVEAVDQPEWTHNERWEGYPGWVQASALIPEPRRWKPNLLVTSKTASLYRTPNLDSPPLLVLSLGSRLKGLRKVKVGFMQGTACLLAASWEIRLPDGTYCFLWGEATPLEELAQRRKDPQGTRESLVRAARLFLGDPYYWGGRSAHDPRTPTPPHTGVDCSGLTGLVYRANGLNIPRDAHEQWMKARIIPREELQPGDLIFLSDEKEPERITHVMLYAGEGRVIEGPGTGAQVREIALEERLKEAPGRRVSYGSYLE